MSMTSFLLLNVLWSLTASAAPPSFVDALLARSRGDRSVAAQGFAQAAGAASDPRDRLEFGRLWLESAQDSSGPWSRARALQFLFPMEARLPNAERVLVLTAEGDRLFREGSRAAWQKALKIFETLAAVPDVSVATTEWAHYQAAWLEHNLGWNAKAVRRLAARLDGLGSLSVSVPFVDAMARDLGRFSKAVPVSLLESLASQHQRNRVFEGWVRAHAEFSGSFPERTVGLLSVTDLSADATTFLVTQLRRLGRQDMRDLACGVASQSARPSRGFLLDACAGAGADALLQIARWFSAEARPEISELRRWMLEQSRFSEAREAVTKAWVQLWANDRSWATRFAIAQKRWDLIFGFWNESEPVIESDASLGFLTSAYLLEQMEGDPIDLETLRGSGTLSLFFRELYPERFGVVWMDLPPVLRDSSWSDDWKALRSMAEFRKHVGTMELTGALPAFRRQLLTGHGIHFDSRVLQRYHGDLVREICEILETRVHEWIESHREDRALAAELVGFLKSIRDHGEHRV